MNRYAISMRSLRLIAALLSVGAAVAQGLRSLKRIAVPQPSNVQHYVRDQTALVLLGKALFWDMQGGSDGRTACATCHFHAGADHRLDNEVSNLAAAGMTANGVLSASDFPFHVLANPANNRSTVVRDSAAVVGSAGVFSRFLTGIQTGSAAENGYDLATTPEFSLAGVNTRQVTTRNTPSVINAVFYVRNFWDGRASDVFNGATPFGSSDTGVHALNVSTGSAAPEDVRVGNASLASQAVGPALSSTEMSYSG